MDEFKKKVMKTTVMVSLIAYGIIAVTALTFYVNFLYKKFEINHLINASTMKKTVERKTLEIANKLAGENASEDDLYNAMHLFSAIKTDDPSNQDLQQDLKTFKNKLIAFGKENYIDKRNCERGEQFYQGFSAFIPDKESDEELAVCYKQEAENTGNKNVPNARGLYKQAVQYAKKLSVLDPTNTTANEIIKTAGFEEIKLGMVSIGGLFYIDKNDVTVAEYRECVDAGKCQKPATSDVISNNDNNPVVGVTWYDAQTYCRSVGKRLPTEAEWEKAARGTDNRSYICGNEPYCFGSCNRICASVGGCIEHAPCEVGSHPGDVSPYGVFDMAGNVKNWCNDKTGKNLRIIKGGAWDTNDTKNLAISPSENGVFEIDRADPNAHANDVGFRCAYSKKIQ